MQPSGKFLTAPDAEHPGWSAWVLSDDTLFNAQVMGKMLVRREGDRSARLRMLSPERRHANLHGTVHGGMILALIDISLFATAYHVCEAETENSVTLDLETKFLAPAQIGEPLDSVAEVLRETGRMVFLRGLVHQGDALVASFSGTLRKPTKR